MAIASQSIDRMVDEMPLTVRYWASFGLLGLLTVLDYFDLYIVAFLLAVLGPQWHLTFGQSAVILVSAGIGSIVGAVVWGGFADRYGRRALVVAGTLVCGASAALIALVPDGSWLLFALLRFLVGIGLAGAATAAMTLAVEYTPNRWRILLTGLLVITANFGILLASATAAILLAALGWRGVATIGIAPAVAGILFLGIAPESARWLTAKGRREEARAAHARMLGVSADEIALPAASIATERGVQPWSALLQDQRRLWLTLLLWAGTLTATNGLYLWGPTLVSLSLGISSAEAGRIFSYVATAGIVGKLIFSVLPIKTGRRWANTLGCLGAAALLLAIAAFHQERVAGIPMLVILLIACALFLDGVISNIAPYTVEIYPTGLAARGYGLGQAANGVGKIAGPLVLAIIAGTDNFVAPKATLEAMSPALVFLAGCVLASALASIAIPIDPIREQADDARLPERKTVAS